MTKKSFPGLSLTVISAVVFFTVLVYSVHVANNQLSRVYTSIQKHTQFLSDLSSGVKAAPLSQTERIAAVSTVELTVCAPATPDPRSKSNSKEGAVDPEDSSAENAAEVKPNKTNTAKCKDAVAPASPGSNPANNKSKATPFSNKSKMHGAQKHFGVGLRFTI